MSVRGYTHLSRSKRLVRWRYPYLTEYVTMLGGDIPAHHMFKKLEEEKTTSKILRYILPFKFHIYTDNSHSHPHFTFHIPFFTFTFHIAPFHIHISHSTFHLHIPYFKLHLAFHISLLHSTSTSTSTHKILPN